MRSHRDHVYLLVFDEPEDRVGYCATLQNNFVLHVSPILPRCQLAHFLFRIANLLRINLIDQGWGDVAGMNRHERLGHMQNEQLGPALPGERVGILTRPLGKLRKIYRTQDSLDFQHGGFYETSGLWLNALGAGFAGTVNVAAGDRH